MHTLMVSHASSVIHPQLLLVLPETAVFTGFPEMYELMGLVRGAIETKLTLALSISSACFMRSPRLSPSEAHEAAVLHFMS